MTPEIGQLGHVTHVILAFMSSPLFNEPGRSEWPLWDGRHSVDYIRARFPKETKVMIAIGGWGDTFGFSAAARDENTRKDFADSVARMVSATGVDGKVRPLR